ncbi:hypothetical protein [Bryobacter aggregatus]|uniref:hypothetical protein n=1 Tax=Bryobacter aggregatus TaxID=360054 RepID=UPI0004E219BF|nr:hypothetical protein [Bryobacter aggregatus]
MKRFLPFLFVLLSQAQVYSPIVTKAGQADTSSLPTLVRDIYAEAHARTPREKAEAIWRFFLTDGRFVQPGMIYHIAGWAYEEPKGEVLDPLKLLNSYGFGLCYHIAPLLEATFEAGGFVDARVWFLTGHTVAEVFYDGAYHYFDSDMMGYNTTGGGLVASVRQLEKDGSILSRHLAKPPDSPWYPADVRANAIGGLAELFTTAQDNWVYPYQRYSEGHTMDFVLRPGERMIRSFRPVADHLYYLPFADGREFPQEIAEYKIRTQDGPRSQKDSRVWGTGRMEYRPEAKSSFTVAMHSPYVMIDAQFQMNLEVQAGDSLHIETSTDGGSRWLRAGTIAGPHNGPWTVSPALLARGEHGKQSAVSGHYSYLVRFTSKAAQIRDLVLATDFALNPRTLPALVSGHNEIHVRTAGVARHPIPVTPSQVAEIATLSNAVYVEEAGQGFVRNEKPGPGSVTFRLSSLTGFDAGGRFLDLRDGLAPDKFTAELRKISPWPKTGTPSATISWATSLRGPWRTLWRHEPKLQWLDGDPIDRTLRWPEVDRHVRDLPNSTEEVYLRYEFDGMAIDDFRLARYSAAAKQPSPFLVTHVWKENGQEKREQKQIGNGKGSYSIDVPEGAIENVAILLECPRQEPVK